MTFDDKGRDPFDSAPTAFDLVRRAGRGEITRRELFALLRSWRYEDDYKTDGLADDWEFVTNSFDAVEAAYLMGLLTTQEYEEIAREAPPSPNTEGGRQYPDPPLDPLPGGGS